MTNRPLRSVEYAAGQVIAHLKMHVSRTAPAPERMREFVLADLVFMDEHRNEYMLMAAMFYERNLGSRVSQHEEHGTNSLRLHRGNV